MFHHLFDKRITHTYRIGTSLERQLYIRQIIPGVTSPEKQLLKFERVSVPAGDTAEVCFALTTDELEVWDERLERRAYSGFVEIMVGKSSRDEDLQVLRLSCGAPCSVIQR